MIEVEKNFAIGPEDKKCLTEGATLLARKVFTDVYYDSPDYALTGNDFWLRTREGKFELKVPQNTGHIKDRITDQYEEDEMDFGFTVFEVELMVKTQEDIPAAEKRIIEFGAAYHLNPQSAGKVIEYLRRFSPTHLAFLQSRGVA